jgi:ankyrin repeat protein
MYKETQAKTILWLINAGARIDRWEGARFCALYGLYKIANHLSDEDYFAILDAMLQKGCDPNAYLDIESSFQKTTLFMQSGLQTQKKLVESGANPILKNIHGGTAMHQAENYEQIQYLQSCGLDINELPPKTEFSYDSRPLHNAMRRDGTCEQAPIDAVEGFLRSGAEPYLLDHSNKNAWWYCRHLETAKILHSYFAFNPNLRDERGNTVVHGIFEWQYRCFNFTLI